MLEEAIQPYPNVTETIKDAVDKMEEKNFYMFGDPDTGDKAVIASVFPPEPAETNEPNQQRGDMLLVGEGHGVEKLSAALRSADIPHTIVVDEASQTVTVLENTDSTTLVTCSIENCDEQFAVPADQADRQWVCPPHNRQALEAEQMSPQQIAKKLQQADLRPRTFWPYRAGTYVKPKTDQPKGKKAVRAAKRARAAALKANRA